MPLVIPAVSESVRGFQATSLEHVSGSGVRVAVIRGLWNDVICSALTAGASRLLKEKSAVVEVFSVAGAFELPFAAKLAQESGRFDAVIAVACLFKGETLHFEYVSEAVVHGLMNLNTNGSKVPVINGVLHCFTEEQALVRIGYPEGENHGEHFALAALQQLRVKALLEENPVAKGA